MVNIKTDLRWQGWAGQGWAGQGPVGVLMNPVMNFGFP
jgi:hypothetical protein